MKIFKLCFILIFACSAFYVNAQEAVANGWGRIVRINDYQLIEGAHVTLQMIEDSTQVHEFVTDHSGRYFFNNLNLIPKIDTLEPPVGIDAYMFKDISYNREGSIHEFSFTSSVSQESPGFISDISGRVKQQLNPSRSSDNIVYSWDASNRSDGIYIFSTPLGSTKFFHCNNDAFYTASSKPKDVFLKSTKPNNNNNNNKTYTFTDFKATLIPGCDITYPNDQFIPQIDTITLSNTGTIMYNHEVNE